MRHLFGTPRELGIVVVLWVLAVAPLRAGGADPETPALKKETEEELIFTDILRVGKPPQAPEAWSVKEPTLAEFEQFQAARRRALTAGADKAKEFYTRFESSQRAYQARYIEMKLLDAAYRSGGTNLLARLETLENAWVKDEKIGAPDRFEVRMQAVNRNISSKGAANEAALMREMEAGARLLLKEFPTEQVPYNMLYIVAMSSEPERAKSLAKELLEGSAPGPIKARVVGLIKRLELVGKKMEVKFTASDGRPVDISAMKGKVVLLDFWATWCGPCVAAMPDLIASYEKYRARGFEIVGINFDQEKEDMEKFVKSKRIAWPHYFDGQAYDENPFGRQFHIDSIPAMLLLDKQGVVRDVAARSGLEAKIEKLLAE